MLGDARAADIEHFEIAVTICPIAKGFATSTLLGTPFDVHTWP